MGPLSQSGWVSHPRVGREGGHSFREGHETGVENERGASRSTRPCAPLAKDAARPKPPGSAWKKVRVGRDDMRGKGGAIGVVEARREACRGDKEATRRAWTRGDAKDEERSEGGIVRTQSGAGDVEADR